MLPRTLAAACAHAKASPQRYRALPANTRYAGPPPRQALLESVEGASGKPAAASASAVCARVRIMLGSWVVEKLAQRLWAYSLGCIAVALLCKQRLRY